MSVFLKAIEVLEERGWVQGAYYEAKDDEGPVSVCLTAALAIAEGALSVCSPSKQATEAVQRQLNLDPIYDGLTQLEDWSVEDWNDDPSTTYEDVVLALKRTHEAEAS